MIPAQCLCFEKDQRKNGKDQQRNNFLNHLKLYERKRTTIVNEADAVGWYLAAILKEGDTPREQDDCN